MRKEKKKKKLKKVLNSFFCFSLCCAIKARTFLIEIFCYGNLPMHAWTLPAGTALRLKSIFHVCIAVFLEFEKSKFVESFVKSWLKLFVEIIVTKLFVEIIVTTFLDSLFLVATFDIFAPLPKQLLLFCLVFRGGVKCPTILLLLFYIFSRRKKRTFFSFNTSSQMPFYKFIRAHSS